MTEQNKLSIFELNLWSSVSMVKSLTLFLLLLLSVSAYATHNRGGNITYEWLGGYTYRVIVFTCTYKDAPADRPQLFDFDWGDGTLDTLDRDSIIVVPAPSGYPEYISQKNYYSGVHTYPGPSSYLLCVVDPNRNAYINNIASSVSVPFALQTELVISPFVAGSYNNSIQLDECPCPELACVGQPYCYNIAAYDPDGDSLSYELVAPLGDGCNPLPVPQQYVFPDAPNGTPGGGGGNMSIDPITGTVCWVVPNIAGEFNFTIKVKEYRDGIYMGFVIRDIQLFVLSGSCSSNPPPSIEAIEDTCVVAGDSLRIPVVFSDNGIVTLSSYGQPFTASPAAFMVPGPVTNPDTSYFVWNTGCSNVKPSAYPTYFIAQDNGVPVSLAAVENLFITVNGPPVTGLTVVPQGNGMVITWDPSICSNISGYNIYRRVGLSTYTESCCSQGAAEKMGYTKIGQTNNHSDTSFYDLGNLVIGNTYCYIVVPRFGFDHEGCVSDQVCAQLKMDVPVITNVSVVTTNSTAGVDDICWAMPKELDTTLQYNNHYFYYLVKRTPANGFTGTSVLVHTTNSDTSLAHVDTCFTDLPLNTVDGPYAYKIELYAAGETTPGSGVYDDTLYIGQSNEASSVFVTTIPNDNQIELNWTEVVPWMNTQYEVHKETSPGIFTLLATTTVSSYTDTGLVNGATYCYKIRSIGLYSSPGIINPILNWSQEVCDSPIDLTAPCPPVLKINDDCEAEINFLSWTNPNDYCSDDVMSYNIYYAETDTSPFKLIQSFYSEFDTTFQHNNGNSIAGCYYVTAVDSVQYSNESDPSNKICIDNCPYYWVPNIFTPNGDGDNDMWIPFPYKFIESVDIQVYNRWGNLVFRTTDPDIHWDGSDMNSNEPVNDGTYYFVIIVNTIRLSGLTQELIKGHVSVVRGSNFSGN